MKNVINRAVCYIWKLLRVNPQFSYSVLIKGIFLSVILYVYDMFTGHPRWLMIKNPPAMQELQVWSLGPENALEEGMAIYSSILAWRIASQRSPPGLRSTGSQRVRDDWSNSAHRHSPALVTCLDKEATVHLRARASTHIHYFFSLCQPGSVVNEDGWGGVPPRELWYPNLMVSERDMKSWRNTKTPRWRNKCVCCSFTRSEASAFGSYNFLILASSVQ